MIRVVGEMVRSGHRDTLVRELVSRLRGEIIPAHGDIPKRTDLFIRWGMRKAPWEQRAFLEGTVSCCLDRGYFDDRRFETFSISMQGVHGLSMPLDSVLDLPPRPHPELLPWKDDGEFVQILAPGWSPGHLRTPDHNLSHSWLTDIAVQATEAFGKPAKIRYHPRALPDDFKRQGPLENTFEETFASVSYMSNGAIQTVIAGIPSIVMHPRCPAFSVSSPGMSIIKPDREAWIHDMSHRNYSMRGAKELDRAVEYILLAYEQAKRTGHKWSAPMERPLLTYGIKEYND